LSEFIKYTNCCELAVAILDIFLKKSNITNNGHRLAKTYVGRAPHLLQFNPLVYTIFDDMTELDSVACIEPLLLKDPDGGHRVLVAEFSDESLIVIDPSVRQQVTNLSVIDTRPRILMKQSVLSPVKKALLEPTCIARHAVCASTIPIQFNMDKIDTRRLRDLFDTIGLGNHVVYTGHDEPSIIARHAKETRTRIFRELDID